jgi:hypothetical protein
MLFIIVKVFSIRQSSFPKTRLPIQKWACTHRPILHMMLAYTKRGMHCEKKNQLLFVAAVGQTDTSRLRASHYSDNSLSSYQDYHLSDNI